MWQKLAALFGRPDRKTVVVCVTSLVVVSVYAYQGHHTFFSATFAPAGGPLPWSQWWPHLWQFGASALLLGIVPLVLWCLVLGGRPAALGLRLGDWRFGLKAVAVGLVVLPPLLYVNAGDPAFRAEYPLAASAGASVGHFLLWEACYLVYYVGWEFHFRGFLQLGLAKGLGAFGATVVQAFPSVLLHIGPSPKPEAETLSAIVAAFVFGAIALRTRSVLYVLLLHWTVGMMTDAFCLLRSGG
jgi:membrane protease YdiL (CAAX protease family)